MSIENSRTVPVSEVMIPLTQIPIVSESAIFQEALKKMIDRGLGIACIVDVVGKLRAVITDGDIRRMLLKNQKPLSALLVDDAINHAMLTPVTITPDSTLGNAIDIMEEKAIWDLPIVDGQSTLVGLVHLHPIVKALLGV